MICTMGRELIISPEVEAKRKRVEELRQEYLALFTQKDQMLNVEMSDLNIRYIKLIGQLKYECFKLSVEVRALKMKVELAQASINRGEMPDVDSIVNIVSARLEDYYKMVQHQAQAVKAAREAESISVDDIKELKDLYRLLVKRLHPDLHPSQDQRMVDLYIQGQAAYRSLNLPMLREIVMRIDIDADIDDLVAKKETLDEMIERLEGQIAQMRADIEKLNSTFPFDHRDKLSDEEWITNERNELMKEREQLEAQKKMYEERFNLQTTL